jgi:hypothetical protein
VRGVILTGAILTLVMGVVGLGVLKYGAIFILVFVFLMLCGAVGGRL